MKKILVHRAARIDQQVPLEEADCDPVYRYQGILEGKTFNCVAVTMDWVLHELNCLSGGQSLTSTYRDTKLPWFQIIGTGGFENQLYVHVWTNKNGDVAKIEMIT